MPAYKSIKYPKEKREMIIIDDGSADESVAYIKKRLPEIKLIAYQKNRGPQHAVNMGIKAARGPILFIVNNDVIVNKNAFLVAAKYLQKHPSVGLLSGKIFNLEPKPGEGKIFNPGFMLNRYAGFIIQDLGSFNKVRDCDWQPATALFVRKKVFEDVGLFEEKLRFCEDGEFSLRAKLAGYKIIHHPKLIFYHGHGTVFRTPDKKGLDYERIFQKRHYLYFQGKFYIILRHGTVLQILSSTILQFSLLPLYNLIVLRNNTVLPMLRAARHTVLSIKEIWADRRRLKKIVKRKFER